MEYSYMFRGLDLTDEQKVSLDTRIENKEKEDQTLVHYNTKYDAWFFNQSYFTCEIEGGYSTQLQAEIAFVIKRNNPDIAYEKLQMLSGFIANGLNL